MLKKAFVSEEYNGTSYTSTFTHPTSLKESLNDFSPEEFGLIISIAANALKEFNTSVNTIEYKEMLDAEIKRHTALFDSQKAKIEEQLRLVKLTNQSDGEKVQATHKARLADLDSEIKELQSQLRISELSSSKLREQLTSIKTSSESMLQLTIKEIVDQKEKQHEKEVGRIQAMNKTMLESLEQQARERVSQCDSQHREAMENLRQVYMEQEKKIRKELEKSFASSEKGKQGEQEFEDLAKLHVKWPALENTSKVSHSTDRTCMIRKCKTMFEIKNYTSDIPTKEVDKFERDMEENQDSPLGVFVSMKTNIVGKKSGNFITMNWTSKSQLLLYVNSFYNHSAEDVLTFIDMCADIAWTMFKAAREKPDESETTIHLQGRIEQAKVFIEKELDEMAEFMRSINHNKTFMISAINKQHADNTLRINKNRHTLQEILNVLLGKHEEGPAETPQPDSIELASDEKKKARGRKKAVNNTIP